MMHGQKNIKVPVGFEVNYTHPKYTRQLNIHASKNQSTEFLTVLERT